MVFGLNKTPKNYELEFERIIDYSKALAQHQTLRRKIGNIFNDIHVNVVLDIFNTIFTLMVNVETIWATYSPEPFRNTTWGSFNFCLHLYFLIEFGLRQYAAKDRKKFFFLFQSMVDLVSTIPFFCH